MGLAGEGEGGIPSLPPPLPVHSCTAQLRTHPAAPPLPSPAGDPQLMGGDGQDVRGKVSMKKLFGRRNIKKDGTEGKVGGGVGGVGVAGGVGAPGCTQAPQASPGRRLAAVPHAVTRRRAAGRYPGG